ncbi:LysR substrate-binding domain-containing protein [Ideonella azotifigens]|uniref:LysR substrate-binding domain-containing protein n=2 Tax=Ideonella azotifigens TaxID=513160 RepID=A0ABP3V0T6_9BURK|nr:LysR family transcriptional regulator [Ideonella azotifigens]MCD2341012.1 LysR substrate-binding domain-containing protein [Ideonella azotifigens]
MGPTLNPSLLSWLRCFDAAARCESFTHAASVLCITQGAVSQQVKQLEQWLQRPLFLRSPRTLLLTPEGLRLATVLRESFDALEAALLQLRKPEPGAALALSCSPSFAMGWLTPRLGDFFRQHAALDLRVISEFQGLDRQRMAQLGLAAAVRYDPGSAYGDLQATAFLDEWLLPVASPAWLAAHPEVRRAADLRPEHLLHDDQPWDGAGPHEEWQGWLSAAGLALDRLQGGRHFNLSQLAVGAALAGQGVAMGRAALVLEDLATGRLVAPFGTPAGPALRSPASYQFVMNGEPLPGVDLVLAWLNTQAKSFVRQRDALLAGLANRAA